MNEKHTGDGTSEQSAEQNAEQDPQKSYLDAELLADTRDGEQKLGFRNVAATERRLLYRAGESYVELLIPPEDSMSRDGGWLFGQFIRPSDEVKEQFGTPIYAVLQGPSGLTGAARMTPEGEFAVPFQESGDFRLSLEPREGPTVRLAFSH